MELREWRTGSRRYFYAFPHRIVLKRPTTVGTQAGTEMIQTESFFCLLGGLSLTVAPPQILSRTPLKLGAPFCPRWWAGANEQLSQNQLLVRLRDGQTVGTPKSLDHAQQGSRCQQLCQFPAT